jgi:uncharacterized protein YbjQ (UPF0145 family)
MSDNITISTGSIDKAHNILDIIFSAAQKKYGGKGFKAAVFSLDTLSDVEYNTLLDEVYVSSIDILKKKATEIGADAVIDCKFDIEQLIIHEEGLMTSGDALRLQVFVTGTAVKYI